MTAPEPTLDELRSLVASLERDLQTMGAVVQGRDQLQTVKYVEVIAEHLGITEPCERAFLTKMAEQLANLKTQVTAAKLGINPNGR